MNDDKRQKTALFRYGILAPLLSGVAEDALSNQAVFETPQTRSTRPPMGSTPSSPPSHWRGGTTIIANMVLMV